MGQIEELVKAWKKEQPDQFFIKKYNTKIMRLEKCCTPPALDPKLIEKQLLENYGGGRYNFRFYKKGRFIEGSYDLEIAGEEKKGANGMNQDTMLILERIVDKQNESIKALGDSFKEAIRELKQPNNGLNGLEGIKEIVSLFGIGKPRNLAEEKTALEYYQQGVKDGEQRALIQGSPPIGEKEEEPENNGLELIGTLAKPFLEKAAEELFSSADKKKKMAENNLSSDKGQQSPSKAEVKNQMIAKFEPLVEKVKEASRKKTPLEEISLYIIDANPDVYQIIQSSSKAQLTGLKQLFLMSFTLNESEKAYFEQVIQYIKEN